MLPGHYQAVLTVAGKSYRQNFTVTMDPRIKVSQADLAEEFDLKRKLSDAMSATYNEYSEVAALRKALAERQKGLTSNPQAKDANDAMQALVKEVDAVETGNEKAPGFGTLNREITRLATMVEEGDMRPSATLRTASEEDFQSLEKAEAQWQKIKTERIAPINALLQKYQLAALPN